MKYRKGAASFYIVAFSTLILVIIAMSFAGVIISEVSRTSNDDLAQSAYDSALAGVEDAKLAYYNYQSCKDQGAKNGGGVAIDSSIKCDEIIYWVEDEEGRTCGSVGRILGRIPEDSDSEVLVQETDENGNSMEQAYTCAKIDTELEDYKVTVSTGSPTRVAQVKLADKSNDSIKMVRVSWGKISDEQPNFEPFKNNSRIVFPSLARQAAKPPMISLALVQTTDEFNLSDFDYVANNATDRATLFLVPTDEQTDGNMDNNINAYKNGQNIIEADQIVKTNDRTVKNLPFGIHCDDAGYKGFACSVDLILPGPYDAKTNSEGSRSDDTMMFVISNPYNQVAVDVMLEFYDADGLSGSQNSNDEGGDEKALTQKDMQVKIDSTGRANDLYRRVETRISTKDEHYPYPLYGVELLGDDNNSLLQKNMTVTSEHGNYDGVLESLDSRRAD